MTTNNPTPTQQSETLAREPVLLDRNDMLDALALFCAEYDSLGERFKKRLRIAIRAVPPAVRAAVTGPRHYFCSCGGALTAEEYIVHYFEMGHDRGDPAFAAATSAPTPADGFYQAGDVYEATKDFWGDASSPAESVDSYEVVVYREEAAKMAFGAIQSALQDDWAEHYSVLQIAGMIAANIRRISPAAPAERTRVEGEQLATQIVGTVFDNTAASYETLKQTMVERITDWLAAAPADNDTKYGPSLVAFNLKTGIAYCPYCETEFERQSDGGYLTLHDCKGDR